jgi:hypothetical protein
MFWQCVPEQTNTGLVEPELEYQKYSEMRLDLEISAANIWHGWFVK